MREDLLSTKIANNKVMRANDKEREGRRKRINDKQADKENRRIITAKNYRKAVRG